MKRKVNYKISEKRYISHFCWENHQEIRFRSIKISLNDCNLLSTGEHPGVCTRAVALSFICC